MKHYRAWSNLSVGEAGRRLNPVRTQNPSGQVTFWKENSHYWQRQNTVFEKILALLDDFYGNVVLLVTSGKVTWKNEDLEYENWIHILMFQIFSDLLQPEGTWGKYELNLNSFTVWNDEKSQALASKGLENPPLPGKIFSRVFSDVIVVYTSVANIYAFQA